MLALKESILKKFKNKKSPSPQTTSPTATITLSRSLSPSSPSTTSTDSTNSSTILSRPTVLQTSAPSSPAKSTKNNFSQEFQTLQEILESKKIGWEETTLNIISPPLSLSIK